MNSYPLWLIDNILSGTKLLSKKTLQQSDPEKQIDEQKDEIDCSGCVVLPYVKEIDQKLTSICNKLRS